MDSPTVRRAAVALLVALTLAAIAWGVKSLVEAFAILHSTLSYSRIINPSVDPNDNRIQMLILAAGIVAVLAIAGYVVFSKLRDAVDDSDEEELDEEEEAFDDDEEVPRE